MDPISRALIQQLFKIALELKDKIKLVKDNTECCHAIASHINDIETTLRGLTEISDISDKGQVFLSLKALEHCFCECYQFLGQLSKEEDNFLNPIKKIINADKYRDCLEQFNTDLERLSDQLTLTIAIDLRVRRERDQTEVISRLRDAAHDQKQILLAEKKRADDLVTEADRYLDLLRRELIEKTVQSTRKKEERKKRTAAERAELLTTVQALRADQDRLGAQLLAYQHKMGAEVDRIVGKQMGIILRRLDEIQNVQLAGIVACGDDEPRVTLETREEAPFSESPLIYNNLSIAELTFEEKIAKGQWGNIYRGRFACETVAIKLLDILNRENLNVFISEVRALNALGHHDAVVEFKGASLEPDCGCAVFEYMDQGSLETLFKSGRSLPIDIKESIAIQLAEGLAFLHEKDIVHAEINSKNVLLNAVNQAKWIGFGLTKLLGTASGRGAAEVSPTLEWMAPECWLKGRGALSRESDVYSFGLLLWSLFTEKNPYVDFADTHERCTRIQAGYRESLERNIPELYHSLIKGCWDADPKRRPSMQKIAHDLIYIQAQYAEQKGENAKAKKGYETVAQSGNPRALTSLGIFALRGIEEPEHRRNPKQAQILFTEAAKKEYARAMFNLALLMKKGDEGVECDFPLAIYWFHQYLKLKPDDEKAKEKLKECELMQTRMTAK